MAKPEGDVYKFTHFAHKLMAGKGINPLPSDSRRRKDRLALQARAWSLICGVLFQKLAVNYEIKRACDLYSNRRSVCQPVTSGLAPCLAGCLAGSALLLE